MGASEREQDGTRAKENALNFAVGYLNALAGFAPTEQARTSAADALESINTYIMAAATRGEWAREQDR